ncbi:basement membrane-specific heparan sulfate proteoglycan core protein-like isoform X2 [Corticium candelabrum]|uniref:basement membrane-specific heparan sulfate proteoglycan core protein-like isoform X2 n=1 Tax=Corticium candelabrum TaxID=121492 RepID=UPI002E26C8D2|nr:basement membrane-specific heparan sulfate proteoglycan core protein-like isoform X2 [Corticium candelabrum]
MRGPDQCPDERSVCYFVTTWSRQDGLPASLGNACGVEGNQYCSSTECDCYCIQRKYTDNPSRYALKMSEGRQQPAISGQQEEISIQFQDRYKSYLALKPPDDVADRLSFSFDIQPNSPDGYIFLFQVGTAYAALYLEKSRLVLAFDLGTGPAIIKSRQILKNGRWYAVKAMRRGKGGIVDVDGAKVGGRSRGSRIRFTASKEKSGKFQLLMGGGPRPNEPSSTLSGFSGCLRKLRVNGKAFTAMATHKLEGRSVTACNMPHPCDRFKTDCGVGGACVVDYPPSENKPRCLCSAGFVYSGSSCQPGPEVCEKGHFRCVNGGACKYDGVRVYCVCKAAFTGKHCETKET